MINNEDHKWGLGHDLSSDELVYSESSINYWPKMFFLVIL